MIIFAGYSLIAGLLVAYFAITEDKEPEFKRVIKCFAWPIILCLSLIKLAFKAACYPFKMIARLM